MTYAEYTAQKTQEISELPLFWAFSTEQLEKALAERGATIDDVMRIDSCGTLVLKKDWETVKAYLSQPPIIDELMRDHDFAVEAFSYELRNYEYCYNLYQGDWDVINGIFGNVEWLGDDAEYFEYLTAIGHKECIPYFEEALREYNRWVDRVGL